MKPNKLEKAVGYFTLAILLMYLGLFIYGMYVIISNWDNIKFAL